MDENQNQTQKEFKHGKSLALDQIINTGRKRLTDLIGLKSLAVVEAIPGGDDHWTLKIEVIEREGIPNTMDIIGLYEALLDHQGQLLSYSRIDMRKRSDNYS